jgi:hypothetical protein
MEPIRLLLDQGNDINEARDLGPGFRSPPPAIVSAVVLEHLEMFTFLRERGAAFESLELVGLAVGRAKTAGLESMLSFLVACGIDIERFQPYFAVDLEGNPIPERPRCAGCERRDKQN